LANIRSRPAADIPDEQLPGEFGTRIHPDATLVLLLDEGAREMWMNAPWELAQSLQKPPPTVALSWQPPPNRTAKLLS